MKRTMLASFAIALATLFAGQTRAFAASGAPVASAVTDQRAGGGSVSRSSTGDHSSEVLCNFIPFSRNPVSLAVTPQQNYMAVSATMSSSPVAQPGNVFSVGSTHIQKV